MEGMDESRCEGSGTENDTCEPFLKKPLYYWVKSFAEKELHEDDSFSNFLTSNAINYALEYIGISSENEQSSLHLSAIFDEDSQQQSRNKYPTHYESETKSRIQNLNIIFVELKSFFEDHFSQLVAIRPPNTVHIASSCQHCSVKELEKLLFLLLGAAIQGTQKQNTIRKIKKFPSEIQETLIECIKLIADNPELINIRSWTEYSALESEEQQKIYENLLSLLRRLITERNESIQTQLVSDYFAGFMNCDQKRIYEGKNYGPESDFEKYSDDTRLSAALRLLKEELYIKSELLQECREELERTKNRVQELENELAETQQTLRSCKKARDELDALREGQEKASRLEAEYYWMKTKLEQTKHICETVESLETENRNLQLKNDILMDKISFLTIERQSHDENSFELLTQSNSHLDIEEDDEYDLNEKSRLLSETSKLFDFEDEVPIKPKPPTEKKSTESQTEDIFIEDKTINSLPLAESTVLEVEDTKDEEYYQSEEEENESNLQSQEFQIVPQEEKSDHSSKVPYQIPSRSPNETRTKRRRRRSSVLNVKRTRRTIFLPLRVGQRLVPVSPTEIASVKGPNNEAMNPALKLFKVYNVEKSKRKSGHAKRNKFMRRRHSGEKQVVPNVDIGNEADEELSLSPNGLPNESDVEEDEVGSKAENDGEIFFVCTSTTAAGAPGRSNFGNVASLSVLPTSGTSTTLNRHSTVHHVNLNNNNSNSVNNNHISSLHVPFLKISNGINVKVGQSDSEGESDHNNDEINFADCNIQVNIRNKNVKPSTALINKISTLSTNLNLNVGNLSDHIHAESSSEDDDSVWYEYGCV